MEVANTLNNFFSLNFIKNLKIPKYFVEDKLLHSISRHPTLNAMRKYKNHPSRSFYLSQVAKEITKWNMNKAVQDPDIGIGKIGRKCWIFCWIYLLQFNDVVCTSKFPASFKFANVTLIFNQCSRNQENNYRPISILPIISKIFEKLICRQLSNQ